MTGEAWMAALAFVLAVPWGGRVVVALLRRGIGKHIRPDEPLSHQIKSGTATMGGLYFLVGAALFALGLAVFGYRDALAPLFAMVAFGALGAYDDLQGLKDVQGVGWLARFKFTWQWALGILVGLALFLAGGERNAFIPVVGVALPLGWWFIPLAAFVLVAMANAMNFTDGLDGLAGGLAAIGFAAFGYLCGRAGQTGLAFFCYALVGLMLAFLWFNVHPARMFMGDTGSQALGAGLAAVALISGYWPLLPLIGIVLVAELLSVMIQVGWFKYTRKRFGEGRRVLRMSPLHYHFELGGWSEVQTTLRFWFIGAAAALLAVGLGGG
ncbi:MAG: phospho-N-acetylmuramoyl-pentapeptide-transferase [Anaerolineae bacterium]